MRPAARTRGEVNKPLNIRPSPSDRADMAVSRPLLLTLVGAMLFVATFVAARGARTVADPASQASVTPPAPTPPKADVGAGKPDAAKPTREQVAERAAKRKAQAAPDPAEKALTERPAKVVGLPAPVAKALASKKVVVLFFFQDAADDDATGTAVNSLREIDGVKVFRDGIANLAKYRAVTASLGVAQAPAVVVVGRDRQAQLVEGYVDQATLAQLVVDAR